MTRTRYPQMRPWNASGDDFIFGCDAPRDADLSELMGAFLDEEGFSLDVLTDDERLRLERCLIFAPLYSVVQRDDDEIGDEGDGGWHTAATGKRRRDCWWVERIPFGELVDEILERERDACSHDEADESGYPVAYSFGPIKEAPNA